MDVNLNSPDFKNNIVTLMQFIKGSINKDKEIPDTPKCLINTEIPEKIKSVKRVVLVVVDGLGYNYISSNIELVNLNRHLIGSIDSVFPTSTASGITSYLSGVSPNIHGVFGWFQWLPEVGILSKPLPFRSRSGNINLHESGINIEDCFNFPSFFNELNVKSYSHSPKLISNAPFNVYATRGSDRISYDTPDQIISNLVSAFGNYESNQYHYVYYPYFDSSCHEFGLDSEETYQEALKIDGFVADLKKDVCDKDAIVIVTSDHGMIDIPSKNQLYISDFPELCGLLSAPLSGEPRVSYCLVESKKRKKFVTTFEETLGQFAYLVESKKMVKNGWFGSEKLWEMCGKERALCDYIILMKQNYTLVDQLPAEPDNSFIGMHGGTTSDELLVPIVCLI